jgi:hypothetical protein
LKTEKLPDVPKQEPGDFYYHHLKLPYAAPPPEQPPFEPDPNIEELIDITSDEGDQLGFVILKKNSTVEIVDVLTGQHVRVIFGVPKRQRRSSQPTTATHAR